MIRLAALRELVVCLLLMFTVFTASVVSQSGALNAGKGGRWERIARLHAPRPLSAQSNSSSHPPLNLATLHPVNCTVGSTDDSAGGDAALRRCASASSQLLVTSASSAVVVPPELKAQAADGDD